MSLRARPHMLLLALILLSACAGAAPSAPPTNGPLLTRPASDAADTATEVPTVAIVECGLDRALLLTPRVRADTSGVAVEFRSPVQRPAGAATWSVMWFEPQFQGRGMTADADGTTTLAVPLAPGADGELGCVPPDADASDPRWKVSPEVIDADGYWSPMGLTCAETMSTSHDGGGTAPQDSARELAAAALGVGVADDALRQLGYPASPYPAYGLVQGAHVVARVEMEIVPDEGQIYVVSVTRCATQHAPPTPSTTASEHPVASRAAATNGRGEKLLATLAS